jgi:two-component system sensor histidine kinase KdpD
MNNRPDPDALLARVQAEAAGPAHGRLKIFFGASAGVGKTYAMLQAAHEQRAAGVDVVAGYIETHRRAETEALIHNLDVLPRRQIAYRGATLEEFDLDAALARHPQLILVDELAHTNAPESRHPKRWQDVVELLDAGINVYTTVNVQHIESLNDVVAQITGVIVRETVPDRIVEQADEVELIDLTPDDLLQRLKEGKVYVPQQAERAVNNFFRKGNLIALRELALRRTADRVDAQMQHYRRDHAIAQTWPTNERLLVAVNPGPLSVRLVRAARRMAQAMRAEWIVVAVETPKTIRLPETARDQLAQTLRLAEQLGAETVMLSGQRASETILSYAHTRNVTKIVVGKPARPRWKEIVFGSTVDELVRRSGEIDVYVITGDPDAAQPAAPRLIERTSSWSAYGWGLLVVAVCTALAALMFPYFAEANLIMTYLFGIVVVASRFGRGPSILASIVSVAAFDFFFVPPRLTFAVSDVQYLITFAVMLAVALVISTMAVRLRQQARSAGQREQRIAALYAMSREFAASRGVKRLLRAAVRNISDTFESQVVILLPNAAGRLQPWGNVAGWWGKDVSEKMVFAPDAHDQGVAQWVYDHGQLAGLGTDTLSGAKALYLPLIASRGAAGVLGVRPAQPRRFVAPDQLHLLETFASQAALALERAELADEAQRAHIEIAAERMRNSLLSSVSHDLRTPLAVITGATSSLQDGAMLDPATRDELARTAYAEANRLNRLVGNLLDMTRIEAGGVQVQKEWQPLEEVVGAALTRLDTQLSNHLLTTALPADLPFVPLDSVLIEQVLVNLLENAIKYTPAGSPIEISASAMPDAVTVAVADRGPGLPPGDEQRIFEKFYRAPLTKDRSGVGLGLTICRGIIAAHNGRIWAENRPGGGAVFRFTLPLDGTPPQIAPEVFTQTNQPLPASE